MLAPVMRLKLASSVAYCKYYKFTFYNLIGREVKELMHMFNLEKMEFVAKNTMIYENQMSEISSLQCY